MTDGGKYFDLIAADIEKAEKAVCEAAEIFVAMGADATFAEHYEPLRQAVQRLQQARAT
jgi:hypothetical protein